MEAFHGTSKNTARSIFSSGIDVTSGGGELGQGFYTTTEYHVAKAWAKKKFPGNHEIMEFDICETEFENLNPLLLNKMESMKFRKNIKDGAVQSSYKFDRNAVWGKIVGGSSSGEDNQIKFESLCGQNLINKSRKNINDAHE